MSEESSFAGGSSASSSGWFEPKLRKLLGGRLRFLAIVTLGLVLLTPGLFSLPPVDRDESRFALASWQMADGTMEDWIVPKLQDRPRLNKPPLIYWLQAGTVRTAAAFGFDSGLRYPSTDDSTPSELHGGIGWYRLVSVACAIGTALLTALVGTSLISRDKRLNLDTRAARLWGTVAGVLMLCSVMMLWDGRQARSDQLLLLWTTASMGVLGLVLMRQRWNAWLWTLLWLCVGIGILSKGPITPLVVMLSLLSYGIVQRDIRGTLKVTKPMLGMLVALLPIVPWVLAVMAEVGASEYLEIIRSETLGRSAQAKEGHWGPPGYHLVLLPLLFWPGSLVTLAAFIALLKRAFQRQTHGEAESQPRRPAFACFLLCWIVPSWIVFELVSTKLPHYTLPLYPALAIASAWGLAHAMRGQLSGWSDKGKLLPYSGFFALGLPVIGLPILGVGLHSTDSAGWTAAPLFSAMGIMCVALSTAAAGLIVWSLTSKTAPIARTLRVQSAGIVCAVCASVGFFSLAQPSRWHVFQSQRLLSSALSHAILGERPIAAVTYREDSLLFLTRGIARRVGARKLDAWFTASPDGIAIVDAAWLQDRPEEVESELRQISEPIIGFNYSSGDPVNVVLVERAR